MLLIPGAMDAGPASWLFWGSLAVALAVAFVLTVPVNRWLIARGQGHAVVHRYHHASPDRGGLAGASWRPLGSPRLGLSRCPAPRPPTGPRHPLPAPREAAPRGRAATGQRPGDRGRGVRMSRIPPPRPEGDRLSPDDSGSPFDDLPHRAHDRRAARRRVAVHAASPRPPSVGLASAWRSRWSSSGSPTGCGPCPSVDIGPRATADRAPTPSSEVTQVRLLANGREGETARAGRAPARRGRPGTT